VISESARAEASSSNAPNPVSSQKDVLDHLRLEPGPQPAPGAQTCDERCHAAGPVALGSGEWGGRLGVDPGEGAKPGEDPVVGAVHPAAGPQAALGLEADAVIEMPDGRWQHSRSGSACEVSPSSRSVR